jgi:hypothetical protein
MRVGTGLTKMVAGVSLMAIAGTEASAQTSADGTSVTCSPNNVCRVTSSDGNERNSATIRVSGTGNDVLVQVAGDDDSSTIDVVRDKNRVRNDQRGDKLTAVIKIDGNLNTSEIYQAGTRNSATVTQIGDSNRSIVRADWTRSNDNVVSVSQNGSNLSSDVTQMESGVAVPVAFSSVLVIQSGLGSRSLVTQSDRGNAAVVRLWDGGTGSSQPAGTPLNVSNISQLNSIFALDANGALVEGLRSTSAETSPDTRNVVDVAITGRGNSSGVRQNGIQNQAIVSMLGGGGGYDPEFGVEGNRSDIRQYGRGLSAEVSSGGLGGKGNSSFIEQGSDVNEIAHDHTALAWQRGLSDSLSILQRDNKLGGAGRSSGQSGSRADVSQRSRRGYVLITQQGTNSATVSQGNLPEGSTDLQSVAIGQADAGDEVSGGVATARQNVVEVSQSGSAVMVEAYQNAINARADLWQKLNSNGLRMLVEQGAGSAWVNLTATVNQEGQGAYADIKQSSPIAQHSGRNLKAEVYQVAVAAPGETNVSASVTQRGAFNETVVRQNGSLLNALVNQEGTGTDARRHLVSITQTGDGHSASVRQRSAVRVSDGSAPAAGPASEPFARAAGENSSEVLILQSGALEAGGASLGNIAEIEQRGAGQYARIEQDGRGNRAGILQQATAINAVAVIQQTGNDNVYYIVQDAPGQYLRVRQNGSGNTVASGFGPANAAGGAAGGAGGTVNPFQP